METTVIQMQRLEKYISTSKISVDGIFSRTISKLYNREVKRIKQTILSLQEQLHEFEKEYSMKSNIFKKKYDLGSLGDDIDFVEWSSTLEMLENATKIINTKIPLSLAR